MTAGALALAFAALLAACSGRADERVSTPLVDGLHAPDLLVEGRTLAPPPETEANRFLTGWRGARRGGELWLTASQPGARLEIASLASRERTLVLEGEVSDDGGPATARVSISGGPELEVPLAPRTEIPLPVGLGPGRVAVDLVPGEGVTWTVHRAGIEGSAPGAAEVDGGDLLLSGWAAADVIKWLPGGSALEGTLAPPAEPGEGRRLAIAVERQGSAPEVLFEWRPGLLSGLRGERDFRVELGADPGLARIRLLSTGDGPAARWRNLRVMSAVDSPGRIDPPAPPPLVVVYVMDALRTDLVHAAEGRDAVGPTWARLAAGGASFRRHLSQAPNTLPSTKTLFTGQPFLARGGWKLAADGPPTLAELFAAAGYRTGLFSANPNVSAAYGTDRGFEHVAEEVLFNPGAAAAGFNDSAAQVQAAALEWLEGLPEGTPAFLYLHTLHPHNPYDPPAELARRFTSGIDSAVDGSTGSLMAIKQGRHDASDADKRRLVALYAAGFAYNDELLDELLSRLRVRYPDSERLLVLTSDHGEELFDHGGVLHGYTLYDEMLRIPLAVHWPGRVEPGRHEVATDPIDVHATLRELVSDEPAPRGRSLWPELLGGGGGASRVQFAAASSLKGGLFMARSAGMKLVWAPRTGVRWGMGEGLGRSREPEYLFDLTEDPRERRNLAGEPSLEADWLRGRLLAWIQRESALESGVEPADLDPATRERLRALGYLD